MRSEVTNLYVNTILALQMNTTVPRFNSLFVMITLSNILTLFAPNTQNDLQDFPNNMKRIYPFEK